MENAKQEKGEEKKMGVGKKIFNFLINGGLLAIVVVGVAIYLLVSILME